MKERFRQSWEEMKDDPPGERFKRQYYRKQVQERAGRAGRWALAAALIAAGIVLIFIPGPAVVAFALAAALLAEDSLAVAKALDWTEVKLRALSGTKRG